MRVLLTKQNPGNILNERYVMSCQLCFVKYRYNIVRFNLLSAMLCYFTRLLREVCNPMLLVK